MLRMSRFAFDAGPEGSSHNASGFFLRVARATSLKSSSATCVRAILVVPRASSDKKCRGIDFGRQGTSQARRDARHLAQNSDPRLLDIKNTKKGKAASIACL